MKTDFFLMKLCFYLTQDWSSTVSLLKITGGKAEKSVKLTVFIITIRPSFLSTAHLQRSSKDAELCAFQFNFRRRRG